MEELQAGRGCVTRLMLELSLMGTLWNKMGSSLLDSAQEVGWFRWPHGSEKPLSTMERNLSGNDCRRFLRGSAAAVATALFSGMPGRRRFSRWSMPQAGGAARGLRHEVVEPPAGS
jgi:hypothetical protein